MALINKQRASPSHLRLPQSRRVFTTLCFKSAEFITLRLPFPSLSHILLNGACVTNVQGVEMECMSLA